MNKNEPVNARIRLAIAQWPEDAPRGSVTTFCAEHEITRKTFYAIRARARDEGQAAALEPRSRRPKASPTQLTEERKQEALQVRAALESSGLDHGPISVHDKMLSLGMQAPSVASLARIFREKNVARSEPNKKPRASYRRFVYPAPNACWQLDATEYVLAGGRKCVIFQLQDDHSRLAVATHVASGETSEAAIAVVQKGIAARGVPQRLLTDNGAALNPSRRGVEGQLVAYVTSLGVKAITGKPYKPTTQGKNERFHQTLFRWLDKQPLAQSHAELQAQVDQFDHIYNTERPHQGLPGRITPQRSWDATPVAEEPRPSPIPPEANVPEARILGVAQRLTAAAEQEAAASTAGTVNEGAPATVGPERVTGSIIQPSGAGSRTLKAYSNGVVNIGRTIFSLTASMGGRNVIASWDDDGVIFANTEGEVVADYAWPPKGTAYVGISKSRPVLGRDRDSGRLSPKS
ncbi:integrase core domain-containing protein [Paeniglutamicibacter psychrophenolicus]|uniref:Transposase InsO family protein n=1 Tax=Paeniglutamicibacter psychrophenolicus TaxID=257454 RepID=A0ABS4WAX6_9MICC|nr:transposase InsO family protein [Paeniglutamicibacter psychrophenolicus]